MHPAQWLVADEPLQRLESRREFPPRTVYAAYNHDAGPKQIKVRYYNNHEGGQAFQGTEKVKFLAGLWK